MAINASVDDSVRGELENLDAVSLEVVRAVLHGLKIIREECSGHGSMTIKVTPEKVDEVEIMARFRSKPLEQITRPGQ